MEKKAKTEKSERSEKLLSRKKVVFEFPAPEAKEVCLAGDLSLACQWESDEKKHAGHLEGNS